MHGYSGTRRGEKMDPEATSKAVCPRCNGEGYLTLWGVARPDVPCGECRSSRVEAARIRVADMRERGDTGSLDYARALTELWKAEKAWQEAGDTGD